MFVFSVFHVISLYPVKITEKNGSLKKVAVLEFAEFLKKSSIKSMTNFLLKKACSVLNESNGHLLCFRY